MLDLQQKKELAGKVLGLSLEEIEKYCHILEEDLLYVSVPVRGGDSLIVDGKGEVLYASSSISPEKHLEEYKNGRRTSLDKFKRAE